MSLTKGLLKSFQFADESMNRLVANLREAFDKVVDDRALQYGSPLIMLTGGAIPPGRPFIAWRGLGTAKIYLPLAAGQGKNVSSVIWVANLTVSNVEVFPTSPDTIISGSPSRTAYNGDVTIFVSDGINSWVAN